MVLDETIKSRKISYIILIGFLKLNQSHSQETTNVAPWQFKKLAWIKETLLGCLLNFKGGNLNVDYVDCEGQENL